MTTIFLLTFSMLFAVIGCLLLVTDCIIVSKVNKKLKDFNEWYRKYKEEKHNESDTNKH